jgi:hypothetical protein
VFFVGFVRNKLASKAHKDFLLLLIFLPGICEPRLESYCKAWPAIDFLLSVSDNRCFTPQQNSNSSGDKIVMDSFASCHRLFFNLAPEHIQVDGE